MKTLTSNQKKTLRNLAYQIRRDIISNGNGTLGFCAFSSLAFIDTFRQFKKINTTLASVKCRKVDGFFRLDKASKPFKKHEGHSWIEINNGEIIIDITADQFNKGMHQALPSVIFGSKWKDRYVQSCNHFRPIYP